MTGAAGQIRDEAHLKVVPDGTVISWLRIPTDRTSEAVAFIRRERDPAEGVTVWVSPGGWDPMTIEQAGVTFPCQVIRWGEFNMELPVNDVPTLIETLETGGTWAREKALECASRVFRAQGLEPGYSTAELADLVTSTAEVFEKWLDRDEAEPTMAGYAMEGE